MSQYPEVTKRLTTTADALDFADQAQWGTAATGLPRAAIDALAILSAQVRQARADTTTAYINGATD
jgi:hypothetical protein